MRSSILALIAFCALFSAISAQRDTNYDQLVRGELTRLVKNETFEKLKPCENIRQWTEWMRAMNMVNHTNFTNVTSIMRSIKMMTRLSLGLLKPLVKCSAGEVQQVIKKISSVNWEAVEKRVKASLSDVVSGFKNAIKAWKGKEYLAVGDGCGTLMIFISA